MFATVEISVIHGGASPLYDSHVLANDQPVHGRLVWRQICVYEVRVFEFGDLVKEEIGMTPKQFTNVLRLNAVRRELLKRSAENQTINQIARRFGISHLGRFAAAYMRQFGELPSDTLRRWRCPIVR